MRICMGGRYLSIYLLIFINYIDKKSGRERFELSVRSHAHQFSRLAHSTTLPPLRQIPFTPYYTNLQGSVFTI